MPDALNLVYPSAGGTPLTRGADSSEDHESPMFCEARLRMLLAELTRECPALVIWAGELSVPMGRPDGKFGDAVLCAIGSFHKLDTDWRRSTESGRARYFGVRKLGGVDTRLTADGTRCVDGIFGW